MTYSSYELKYCECCGGLGLRRSHSGLPYCSECEQMMQHLSPRQQSHDTVPGQLRRIVFQLGASMLRQPGLAITASEVACAS
jgi:hypothetical protein